MAQELPSTTFPPDLGDRFEEYAQVDPKSEEDVARAISIAARFIEQEMPRLLLDARYKDKYIAVIGERVVDVDGDEAELYFRTVKAYPRAMAVLKKIGADEDEWDDDDDVLEIPFRESAGR